MPLKAALGSAFFGIRYQAIAHYAANRQAYRDDPDHQRWAVRKITGMTFDELDEMLDRAEQLSR